MANLITRKQLSEELQVDPSTIWRWEQKGLKAYSGGRKILYNREEVMEFLEEQRKKAVERKTGGK